MEFCRALRLGRRNGSPQRSEQRPKPCDERHEHMDHLEATSLHAAERYVLGELTTGQRDAFEEHYFECVQCAADVKAAAAFADNARHALRGAPRTEVVSAPRPAPSRGWLWWLRPGYAMGAIAVLLAVVGYQNLVTLPQMKRGSSAQALATFSLLTSGSRATGETTEIAVQHNSPFGIYVDIPSSDRFEAYTCEVTTRDGKGKLKVRVSAAQAKDSVQLFIPGGTLHAGEYELVVHGETAKEADVAQEVARHRFAVKFLP